MPLVPPSAHGSLPDQRCPESSSAAFHDPGADLQATCFDGPKLGERQEAWVGPGRNGLLLPAPGRLCVVPGQLPSPGPLPSPK